MGTNHEGKEKVIVSIARSKGLGNIIIGFKQGAGNRRSLTFFVSTGD